MATSDDLKFDNEAFAEMKRAEVQLVTLLIQLSETTHPLLLCYTLIRCARVFLRKADDATQREMVPVLHAYLRGDINPPQPQQSPLLWTPPGVM